MLKHFHQIDIDVTYNVKWSKTTFTDNGKAMSFSDIKETAYKFCDRQNSILRRYLTAQDICPNGTAQHWTSGWRAVHEYKVSYKGLVIYNMYSTNTCMICIDWRDKKITLLSFHDFCKYFNNELLFDYNNSKCVWVIAWLRD